MDLTKIEPGDMVVFKNGLVGTCLAVTNRDGEWTKIRFRRLHHLIELWYRPDGVSGNCDLQIVKVIKHV